MYEETRRPLLRGRESNPGIATKVRGSDDFWKGVARDLHRSLRNLGVINTGYSPRRTLVAFTKAPSAVYIKFSPELVKHAADLAACTPYQKSPITLLQVFFSL